MKDKLLVKETITHLGFWFVALIGFLTGFFMDDTRLMIFSGIFALWMFQLEINHDLSIIKKRLEVDSK